MYVCVCNGVTERDIDSAIAAGCCSLRQLRDTLGVGNCCGRCATCARAKLKDAQQSRPIHTSSMLQFAAA